MPFYIQRWKCDKDVTGSSQLQKEASLRRPLPLYCMKSRLADYLIVITTFFVALL